MKEQGQKTAVCVLIPAYNEAEQIGEVVEQSKEFVDRVLVVDDGSSDKTAALAEKAGAEVIRHPQNRGKGAALRTGFEKLLGSDCGSVIVLDADGQHQPSEIKTFIQAAEETGADIIIGDRMADSAAMPRIRYYTNRVMSSLLSGVCRQKVPDSQCGYRLIGRNVLETIKFKTSNYDTESEMLIEASRHGFRLGSVPIKTIYTGQISTIRPLRDTWRFIRLLAGSCHTQKKPEIGVKR